MVREEEIFLGGIETRLPKRFREGRPSPVIVSLLEAPPAVRTITIVVDTLRYEGGPAPIIEPETIAVTLDTTSMSRRVRVTLHFDTVNGPAFTIDRHHGAAEQTIRATVPARWSFQVTPLKAGPQKLFIALDLLPETGETHLGTIIKEINVQVDSWWRVRRWFRVNIAPILVGSILLPLLGFIGKKLVDGKKNAEEVNG